MYSAYAPVSATAKISLDPVIRWHVPDPALQHVVDGVWSFEFAVPDKVPYIEHSLPDGGVDLIMECRQGGLRRAFVRGPAGRGTQIRLDRNVYYIGIRVRPGMARAVLGIGAVELRERRVDLQHVNRRLHAALAASVGKTAAETATRVDTVLRHLSADIRHTCISAAALPLMRNSGGCCSVQQVAATMGWSVRKLHRRVSIELGLSPKLFMRTIRLQRALLLLKRSNMPKALAAVEAGYTDQAHMCRDFFELTASTPAALAAQPIPHEALIHRD